MHDVLYLDTARLGRMSHRTFRAATDVARVAHEQGSTLYFDDFMRCGGSILNAAELSRYPSFADWQGPARLSDRIRTLAGAGELWEVVFASRSANLMSLAARLQIRLCRKVLVTDLSWPFYEHLHRREQRESCNAVYRVEIHDDILRRQWSSDELLDKLVTQYIAQGCDGLFLPLVDHRGIRLPIQELVTRIRRRAELRFCVVDAAQAFQQVPLELSSDYCDLVIAGCHKWLASHVPMGLAFYGREPSRRFVGESIARWLNDGSLGDPLLQYTNELFTGNANAYGETTALLPLLTANAAAIDAQVGTTEIGYPKNREAVLGCVANSHWQAILPDGSFDSQVILIESPSHPLVDARRHFLQHGVAVTAYDNGTVRLALPKSPIDPNAFGQLTAALQ